MLIETQHFQQLQRHLSYQTSHRFDQLMHYGWGFTQLDIDESSLRLGKLGLRRARGVLPDGTVFSLPSDDPLPPLLETHSAGIGDVACLAIQASNSGAPEMSFEEGSSATRYRAVPTEVPDLSVGLEGLGALRRLTIETGQLATRLCWHSQLRSDEVSLAVARVSGRSNDGNVLLDERFIAPLLDVRAHPSLRALMEELQGTLRVRLEGSAAWRVLSAEGGVADLIELLLRQSTAEYRMRLDNLATFVPLPPATLFHELVGLLGRLSILPGFDAAFTDNRVRYRHDDLQSSFEPLAALLRDALSRVIETPVLSLPFEDRGDQTYICVIDRHWKIKKLIFAFSAAMPSERLRHLLPQQAKLCSVEHIQRLVDLQLPGARLLALAHPPRQIPYYAQSTYFEVEATDSYWDQTLAGSAMALRIVGDFPELRFEAWGLKDGKVA
jgi:type VI secretion system protein ImpJ